MSRLDGIKKKLASLKADLRRDFGVTEIGIFGSYVEGKPHSRSDLDVLVEFKEAPGFFKFLELEERLSELLGVRVDLVTRAALKPRIGRRILDHVVFV
jgi:predicted nucleotidyltransferase